MELRHLRYFVTVAECGSVSRAATKLFIAQPPLSAQIRQLEEEVGAPLLLRLPRGVKLTAAGVSFLEDARAILARSQQAVVRARERQSGHRSTLRLAVMPSATHSILPGFLKRLEDTKLRGVKLDVAVEVREMIPSSRQLQALRNSEIDIGFIRPGEDALPPETVHHIDDPYCLAIAASHPLARHKGTLPLKAAAHERFIGFSRHHESDYFDQTAALCVEAGFRPDLRHEAGQFVSVLAMVACGLGVAIVPASCAVLRPEAVVFRRLTGSRHKSRLVMVRSEQAAQDEWSRKVIEAARAQMKALAASLKA